MASLHKQKTKTGSTVWRIRFTLAGQRKGVRLGAVPKKLAETVCSRVEELINSRLANVGYSQETARWLGGIDDDLHEKLSKAGLVEARINKRLAGFLQSMLDERIDLKLRTRQKYATSIKSLVTFFGDAGLKEVTPEKAALYRIHLIQSGFKTATVSKMIGMARQFFSLAKRRKLIDDNPFADVETGSQVNKDREHYRKIPASNTSGFWQRAVAQSPRWQIVEHGQSTRYVFKRAKATAGPWDGPRLFIVC